MRAHSGARKQSELPDIGKPRGIEGQERKRESFQPLSTSNRPGWTDCRRGSAQGEPVIPGVKKLKISAGSYQPMAQRRQRRDHHTKTNQQGMLLELSDQALVSQVLRIVV